MAASIYPPYPPDLTDAQRQFLITSIRDWSIAHGLAVRPAPSFVPEDTDPAGVLAATAPVTLFPSPFPRHCFQEGREIQTAYNELYAAIARDEEWLRGIVEEYVFHTLILLTRRSKRARINLGISSYTAHDRVRELTTFALD